MKESFKHVFEISAGISFFWVVAMLMALLKPGVLSNFVMVTAIPSFSVFVISVVILVFLNIDTKHFASKKSGGSKQSSGKTVDVSYID